MWNSFDTTVSTPAKWLGRTAPSSSAASGPGVTIVSAPAGYMSSTPGGEHQLDTLLAAGLEIGLERAGVAVEIFVRPELEWVDEDRDRDDGGARHPPRVPDQLPVALVQRAHRGDEQHAAPGRAQGPGDRRDARRGAVHRELARGVAPGGAGCGHAGSSRVDSTSLAACSGRRPAAAARWAARTAIAR